MILQEEKYSRRLFYSSALAIVSVYSAWYHALYWAMIRCILVMTTSLLYWNNPKDGIVRKIDIVSANVSIGYQWIYTSMQLSVVSWILYNFTVFGCIGCYRNARYYGRKTIPDFDMASRWHMGIHILGNVGNLILYHGITI